MLFFSNPGPKYTPSSNRLSTEKCHVLLSTDQQVHTNLGTAQIKNSQYEKLLGVTIDTKLNFKTHIQQICGKIECKIKGLG